MSASLPLAVEIPYADWSRGLSVFAHLPRVVFFDSARQDSPLGRCSLLAADPFESWLVPSGAPSLLARQMFDEVVKKTRFYRQDGRSELPPFQGGAAGVWSYELNRAFEDVPAARTDDVQTPRLGVGLYDVVLAVDHDRRQAWLISQGFPETEEARRIRRARERLEFFVQQLRCQKTPDEVTAFSPSWNPMSAGPIAARWATSVLVETQISIS